MVGVPGVAGVVSLGEEEGAERIVVEIWIWFVDVVSLTQMVDRDGVALSDVALSDTLLSTHRVEVDGLALVEVDGLVLVEVDGLVLSDEDVALCGVSVCMATLSETPLSILIVDLEATDSFIVSPA